MPQISHRGAVMPASPIRKLVPLCNQARAKGLKVYQLNIGQPDIPSPPEAFEALRNLNLKVLEYSPSEGIQSLRQKMKEYDDRFHISLRADDIIVTSGGSEAVLFAFLACLNPGDEVIIPEPAYANYISFSIMAGVKIIPIQASIDDGFSLPPIEEIEKSITPRTKGILICNPNNPTGYLYTPKELDRICELVKRHDLFLFSDEVYREFCYTGAPYKSALQLEGIEDKVVLIDSVSKRYSECGIRIGAIVSRSEEIRDAVMKFCMARLSPPLLGQIVAEASIDCSLDYMRMNYNEYLERRNFLVDGINRIPGCFTPIPMGAFYTVVSLPVDDAERFCRWCLTDFQYEGATIFMAPGSGFYSDPERGKNEVRMAYVLCKEDLAKAIRILAEALKAYPGRTNP